LHSKFAEKIHESAVSVLPVIAIVLILHFTATPLPEGQLLHFLAGGILLILGLGIFLIGADLGMVAFGQKVGSALTHKRNLPLLLFASFSIGFAITIAEPDVQVLVTQVHAVVPAIGSRVLLFMIAGGVGVFLLLGAVRAVLRIPLSRLLIFFYALVLLGCAFVDAGFIGVAFDAGGATTGPVTVPFIMALGIGIAASAKKKEGDDSSFGLVGMASIGPIAAVIAMGMLSSTGMGGGEIPAAAEEQRSLVQIYLHIVPEVGREIAMALLPLLLIFLFFQFTLLRLPALQVKRMMTGMFYAFIGLVLFMSGVDGGFIPTGRALGLAMGGMGQGWALIPTGLMLGAVVVCAEPAVWVLTEQVEDISGGYVKRRVLLVALSLSVALAVATGMLRVVTGMSIWYVLLPGYALALGLTRFCPPLFTAIAFDSGGVASGPMSSTFVLALTLGASIAVGGNPSTDAFGMIAMIALAPLITIQLLGLMFKHVERKQKQKKKEAGHA
jgi:hypothetical protein